MAVAEFFTLSVLLAVQLAISTTNADSWFPNDAVSSPESLNSHSLHSTIVYLESSMAEKSCELAERDESVKEIQNIIQEKSDTIVSLQSEIEVLQESINGHDQIDKSNKQASELEKQIERLRNDIEMQNKKKDRLGTRASVVEKRIDNLKLKLEQLYKANDEQENSIRKTEDLLQVAEKELVNAEAETDLQSDDLNQAQARHEEWFRGWDSVNFGHIQMSIMSYWNEHGRQAMDLSIQKGVDTKARLGEWARLQIEMIRMDWIPIMKEELLAFITSLKPLVQSLIKSIIDLYNVSYDSLVAHTSKILNDSVPYAQEQGMAFVTHVKHYVRLLTPTIVDMYYSCKSSIVPRAFMTVKILGFYAQKTRNFTESYMQQTAIVSRPLIDKAYFALKSHAFEVFHSFGQILKVSISYHHRVQEMLKHNEVVQPVANVELAWFVATALLAVPALILLKVYSAVTRKTAAERSQSVGSRRRKPKQSDK